jgi:uncharacterized membrane protein YqjE
MIGVVPTLFALMVLTVWAIWAVYGLARFVIFIVRSFTEKKPVQGAKI